VNVHASGSHEGENTANGADVHDGGIGVGVVDAGVLTETLCHEPCFEAIGRAIGARLHPFVANGVTTKRETGHSGSAFVMKRSERRPDGSFPLRGIPDRRSVIEVLRNRNVGGTWVGEIGSGTRLRPKV
jgi:hypothetical protein